MTGPIQLRVEDQPAAPGATRWRPQARTPRPRLSWTVPLDHRGHRQVAWQVRAVAAGSDPLTASAVWESGRVESEQTLHVVWGGVELAPHTHLAWTVRSWDEAGRVSRWAEPAPLEAGAYNLDQWQATWLDVPARSAALGVLELPASARRARLHLTAQGLVRAVLDGVAVNGDASDPSRTDPSRTLVRGYDVTDLLGTGRHVLALVASRGQVVAGDADPRVLAEVVAELEDGTVLRWGTRPGWRLGSSPLVADEAFYIERHDASLRSDIDDVDAVDLGHLPVASASTPAPSRPLPSAVEPDPGPPVHVVRRVSGVQLGRPAPGVRVYDLGENVAGRSRVVARGVPAGTELRLVHGEVLDGGRVSTLNIRLPHDRDRERQVVEHVCGPGDREVVEPWFAVHGFRYVEVRGLPEDAVVEVSAGVLHSEAARTGSFRCDDLLVQRLVDMAVRTQLNNLHALPEDCPTREQSGWTGDAAAAATAASMHLDMAGLYRKWLDDLAADQRDDGAVPGVSPALGVHTQPPDPVWGAAFHVVVHQHWLHTGDESLVRLHLPGLRRWCTYQLGLLEDGLVRRPEISYGHDWLAPQQTPPVLLQTRAVLESLRTTAVLEDACGDHGAAQQWRLEADRLAAAARAQLRDPVTGLWGNGSQASWASATDFLADDEEGRRRAHDVLRAAVSARGDRLSSGFAGTASVVRALAAADGGSALLRCLHQPAQPGVGAMLVDGPGTFWETWWIDRKNVGVASLDHIGLAAPFAEWAWTHLAGLRPTGPGWSTFDVHPVPPEGVNSVTGEIRTVRGVVRSQWRREGDRLDLAVEVPVGAQARWRLPGGAAAGAQADGVELLRPLDTGGGQAGHPHLRVLGSDGDDLLLLVPAGRFAATVAAHRAPATPALGAVPDVAPGGTVIVHVTGPVIPADLDVGVDQGCAAEVVADESRGPGGLDVVVRAPADARSGTVASLRVTSDGVEVARSHVRVGRAGLWLGDGLLHADWRPGACGTTLEQLPGGVVCEPVFHEPLPGPVLVVRAEDGDPDGSTAAFLALDPPEDLSDAVAVVAHVDFCLPVPAGRGVEAEMVLGSADGTSRRTHLRPLPVGWNRLAVDVSGWAGRTSLNRIDVVVHWPGRSGAPLVDPGHDARRDLAFRLGRVGWSSAPLTW